MPRPRLDGGSLAPRDTAFVAFAREEMERSICDRFSRVIAARPSALAIADGGIHLTYAELGRRVETLAAALLRQGTEPDAPLAVLAAGRTQLITAMLAAWRAGTICVALDPSLPPLRLEATLRHCEARLVLTDGAGSESLRSTSFADVGRLVDELLLADGDGDVFPLRSGDSPACIVYTSGSTGEPKGILRNHRSLLHRARCSIASLALQPDDRVAALHSPASSAGSRDVFAPLLGGATLLPFDLRRSGFGELARFINAEKITVLCTVVSTLRHLLGSLDQQAQFPTLRLVRAGSEPLYRRDIESLRKHVPIDCVMLTGYGATEANGLVEYRIDRATPLPEGRIPAGYPLEGIDIVLQDEGGKSVEGGEPGEVVVRSRYLSSGYWRRPEMTRATFDVDPASGKILSYRTGDIGKLRPDGCLELLGRRDQQVKVRGYRIHPGEIEAALLAHPAVREAAVASFIEADGDVRLVAYVVPQSKAMPTASLLRRHLGSRLPHYMLPSAYVTIDGLPLTANGKVDRRALPMPDLSAAPERDFVPPRSPTEHQLAAIWERIFGVSPIGVHDDFFDLGGDSLRAAELASDIQQTFDRVMAPSLLLQAPTLGALAMAIADLDGDSGESLTALRASGMRTPIFFLHNDGGRGLYTHALARCVDAERPFYAVHRDGLETIAVLPTIEAVAADRIAALRRVRPHGPYVIGGHCHGGLVALEMAHQLRAAGEEVELLVMIDTDAPRLRPLRVAARALRGASEPLQKPWSAVHRIGREIVWRARYYGTRIADLERDGLVAQLRFVQGKLLNSTEYNSVTRLFHAEPPKPLSPRRVFRRAVARYVPPRYPAPVAVFRPEQRPAPAPDLGWSGLIPHLKVVVVPGDHHTCITRHVAAFAARLNEVLERSGR